VRTFVHDAADVGARERILQIGGGRERIHYSVRKFFRQDAREASPELFARDAPSGAARIGAQKFQAAGLGAAAALDFQDDAVAGVFIYAQDAAGRIAFVGPKVHEGIFAFDAEFEMQRSKCGEPFAVFADFHAAGRRQIAKRAIQSRPVVRRRIQLHTVMGMLRRWEKLRRAIAVGGQ
jgi:hypothetical protein